MADRIAIMRDGIIEQVGTPHDVFAKPANVFVASFIGTPQMNLVDADLKSFAAGQATVELAGSPLKIAADPAVSGLKPSKVKIGIRPRAFSAVRQGFGRHDHGPGRADRTDGGGNTDPCSHQDRR